MKKSVQKRVVFLLCALLCATLIIFNSAAMDAARAGFDLWLSAVMPALFPFFVCTSIMGEAGLLRLIAPSKKSGFLSKLRAALSLFLVSAISGSPCGARLTATLCDSGAIDKTSATPMCAACNMLSPMFIIGSLGAMLGSPEAAYSIALGHYGASLIVLLYTSFKAHSGKSVNAETKSKVFRPLPALSQALSEGAFSMIRICATIVFFMVVTRVLDALGFFNIISMPFAKIGVNPDMLSALFSGCLESVGGASAIAQVSGVTMALKCACVAFTITFGGICILSQSTAFLDISMRRYLLQKFITALVAAALTYLSTLILLPDAVHTIGEITSSVDVIQENTLNAAWIFVSSIVGLSAVWLASLVISRTHRR